MAEANLEKPLQFGEGHTTSEDDKKDFVKSKPRQLNHPYCIGTHSGENHAQNGKNTNIIYKPQPNVIIESVNDENRRIPPRVANNNETSMETFGILKPVKVLDANRYATKKTIAQGMLDIALLTANASQLKYILQVGKAHEFYTLMLTLISLSIGLQILSGLLSLSLNLMMDRKMEDTRKGYTAEWVGRARLALSFIVFLDNILIAAFDPTGFTSILLHETSAAVGILFIVVGGLDINKPRDQWAANIINDIILIGVFVISLINVAISGFGMEFSNKPPELLAYKRPVLQALVFLFLGINFNINKEKDLMRAQIWNNIAMAMISLTVLTNISIAVFEVSGN